ncbi:xanthine dehydrogenase molybdenum-binding subunit [Aequitasia blattaphilus]|uniref:Xanthine dehydrogenase molybdenum-binding subunit XdhA n=1 Tax=Aequitasia blattaphilus TaxID=2949332 RepID=A0ABT1E9E3_9FIRM|nr:xanthine dehydrogenase subunit XdhA [Aequitasia blattaphilus]MCP1102408.1 xanthine dehydrogenase molybdenum-binding subunit XdhA [Aequitasia blattaphilus]MCR8615048.1 xanthine dehydrogenase molybdenum-binding subunit XdhA [Aequitasia blattaphilus]
MSIGKNITRVDAELKVTGEAKYTADLVPGNALVGKVVRSTIANGVVKSFNLEAALQVPGVIKIVTCFEVPDCQYPTAGHPWSVEASHQDIADRKLLNTRVRTYGDDIAAIIAENDVAAERGAREIQVEYEIYEPILSTKEAMTPGVVDIHKEFPGNVIKNTEFRVGERSYEEIKEAEEDAVEVEATYRTQAVQHCHIETPISYAYMENDRIVIVSSTQIPHIVRRVVGQALDIPWGKIRVIKPYIGGGFGNKQDVLYEPLNAYLTTLVGGRPVKMEISREETLACTRTRHAIEMQTKALVRKDGRLIARQFAAYSNQGAYASHAHAIVANSANEFKQIYNDAEGMQAQCFTVYTNMPTGGAMRGYGIPQGAFASECQADDIAYKLQMDPLEYRLMNCVKEGYEDPHTHIKFRTNGIRACIDKGRREFGWDEKREKYKKQTGTVRRGVGMAIFCYKTGVYPISLETASCRMVLNQDGSLQMQMGATEIGQGADTAFTQMASETTGITEDKIHIVTAQDTDITPFDTGAYASRQSYVSGKAVKKTGELLVKKILKYAAAMVGMEREQLRLVNNEIVDKNSKELVLPLETVATTAFYSLEHSKHITAEATSQCRDNTFASGVCFAEVEVDIGVGKIEILNILNVHDSGTLINPKLAEAQVHGGMSMGLGYALGEELLFNQETGKPLNDNLLDYKLPTSMDTPDLQVGFIELSDETGPYGNKALGEPPAIPVAPAIRNAVLHATDVAIDSLPLAPQKLICEFRKHGLIQ